MASKIQQNKLLTSNRAITILTNNHWNQQQLAKFTATVTNCVLWLSIATLETDQSALRTRLITLNWPTIFYLTLKTGSMLHRNLEKRQKKSTNNKTHSTSSTFFYGSDWLSQQNEHIDFGNGKHTVLTKTWPDTCSLNINLTVKKLTKRLPLTFTSTTKTIDIITANLKTTKTAQITYQCNPPPHYVNSIVGCVCHQCSNKFLSEKKLSVYM